MSCAESDAELAGLGKRALITDIKDLREKLRYRQLTIDELKEEIAILERKLRERK